MPEGVVHLRDARHLAEQLTTSSLQLGGRAVDIVDSETEDEAIVKPPGRDGLGCVGIEKCAVRHGDHRPTRLLHCRAETERPGEELVGCGELIGAEHDRMPGDPLDIQDRSLLVSRETPPDVFPGRS
jgi:hypothetical protein